MTYPQFGEVAAAAMAHNARMAAEIATARAARTYTPARTHPDGSRTITMKRYCNGCDQPGDAR